MSPEDKGPRAKRTGAGKKKSSDGKTGGAVHARPVEVSAAPKDNGSNTKAFAFAALALLAGGAGGWFIRDKRAAADTPITTQPDPAAAGSVSGPMCASWAKKVCEGAGPTSEGCNQANAAASFLSDAACQQAIADVGATVEKFKAQRSSCDQLVTKLCADLGPTTETCKMVQEKTPQMGAEQCKQMLGQYDGVLEELKEMEAQNAPLSAEQATKIAAGDTPGFGPADAKVTIVEYSDFECPYCGQAAETVKQLKERYSSVVRFVFRQFPLPMHPNAPLAAQAALAAHAQGKFFEFHDLMFQNQQKLERASLEEYATKVGLDMAKFKKALDDKTYEAAVKADQKLGEEIHVSGTPTMIVGTQRVRSPDYDTVSAEVDKQLQAAGVAVPPAK